MTDQIGTGDTVLHTPTGEEWLVARVDGAKLAWMGWPPGWSDRADCTLVRKATSEEREKVLRMLAASAHHCAVWAKAQIAGKQQP